MKLFYRKIGEGKPIIILHGLFGQSDNWNSFAKQFKESGYAIYLVDVRNHGHSPHSDSWNYQVMSDDVYELINDNDLTKDGKIILIGHSMGGKIAMQFTINYPELLYKLIVVDIGPKHYPPHHQEILKALNSVDLPLLKTRKDADVILSKYINDVGTKQFLLKNLYWTDGTKESAVGNIGFNWRFNLKIISSKIDNVGEAIAEGISSNTSTLLIKGSKSNYILNEDATFIKSTFPNSVIETINDAGHWVHAEKPKELYERMMNFIN